MPTILVWDWDLKALQDKGLIVKCSQCQYPVDVGPRMATCPIVCAQVLLDEPLICSAFKERTSD